MTLIDDLKAAKAELVKRGWGKGDLVRHDGSVCALGAVGCALVEDFHQDWSYAPFHTEPRVKAVVSALANQMDVKDSDDIDTVFYNNDHPATTVQDIYDYFDKALAEAGGLA